MDERVLIEAQFDPKVKVYWYLQGMLVHASLVLAVIGIFTLPLWIVFGMLVVGRRYDAMSAHLSERSIHLQMGVLNRVEKTVPLEKIQDLSLRTGPLLNAFGLASVQVETAGGSAQAGADMTLPGLANAQEFRDAVLNQRDKRADGPQRPGPDSTESTVALLTEIRDTLVRIEGDLAAARAR